MKRWWREVRLYMAVAFLGWILALVGDDLSNDGLRALILLGEEIQKS